MTTETRRRSKKAFEAELDRVIASYVARSTPAASPPPKRMPSPRLTLAEATRRFQLAYVQQALEEHRGPRRWNINATASALGVSRSFIYTLIEETKAPRKRASR